MKSRLINELLVKVSTMSRRKKWSWENDGMTHTPLRGVKNTLKRLKKKKKIVLKEKERHGRGKGRHVHGTLNAMRDSPFDEKHLYICI